jgi:mannan endo-1,4-beta-mannosidase
LDVLKLDGSPSSDTGSCKGATAAQAPSGVTPFRAIDGFVTRNGSELSLCGQPFQVLGTNLYYLQSYSVYEAGNLRTVADGLDDAVRMSLPVVRMWAYNASAGDGAIIETAAGKYVEPGLVGLDTAIAEAKKRGIRVILTRTNYWTDYGGLAQYAKWAGASSAQDFYTNTTMQGYFKEYATMLSQRTNTVTKVAYKDEPAILAWEIANELRCPTCADASPVTATIDTLSKFLKSLFPNQLIADGGEGMDDTAGNWGTFSNNYPVNGWERTSFTNMVKLSALDMVSYHYYPADWGMATTPATSVSSDAKAWIDGHAALAKAAGKVAYWGEFGFKRGATDAERAPLYDDWLARFFGAADTGAMALFWQLVPQSRGADDGFACILGRDTNTVTVFEKYSVSRAPR